MLSVIKTGFIRFLLKVAGKSSKLKNEKKICVFDGLSNLNQKLSKNHLTISNNTLAQIMHFS